ncbi:MAG: CBS domain-containing protein [Nitrosopumilus sp.]|nr:CBS domain-containing protein [Nitrosopumilus sp.]MDH3735626.1 CBS domain-containing protein [Nitrosopumilus sp.]MDH3822578.1 CBS domain-containing protein [Nitrosopumilus sp.]
MTQLRSVLQMPITIQSDASLYHAISRLLQGDISRLIVTGGPDVQIVTEKDIGMFLLTDESGKALEDIPVSQIARRFVSVHENMTVQGAAEIMVDRDIGSVGVYCNDEGLIGIVTKTDLTKYYFENFVGHNRIGDLMTITYTSMDSEDSLNKVITKMIDERISRIFLKNQNNEPEGILTFRDLFQIALTEGRSDMVIDNSDPAISVVFPRRGFLSESGFGETTLAKDAMSKKIVSVDYNDDLIIACSTMIENKINGVGVTINDKISGVISKSDIIKAMTQIKE